MVYRLLHVPRVGTVKHFKVHRSTEEQNLLFPTAAFKGLMCWKVNALLIVAAGDTHLVCGSIKYQLLVFLIVTCDTGLGHGEIS